MASYEDIKKANESIKTLAIEHKDKDGNIVLEKTTYEEWLRSSEE